MKIILSILSILIMSCNPHTLTQGEIDRVNSGSCLPQQIISAEECLGLIDATECIQDKFDIKMEIIPGFCVSNAVTVSFPPGTYYLSDTLKLKQGSKISTDSTLNKGAAIFHFDNVGESVEWWRAEKIE